MSNNKYDIDGLIAYFEMAVENSYEYHAAEMLKKLRSALREAVAKNVELANSVHVLEKQYGVVLEERDNARWEVCELSSNGSIDDATRISVERGWSDVNTTQYWCDSCADPIEIGNEFFYSDLPCDIASANEGESGTVCRKCNERIEADYYNKKEKENESE